MPNWCVNKLRVSGSPAEVCHFFRFIAGTTEEQDFATLLEGKDLPVRFDYNDFLPYPIEFTRQDEVAEEAERAGNYDVKDGYNSGGYDWCISHWGTKWNASDVTRASRNVLQFNSPWSPPKPVITAAALRFPALTFTLRYFECGMSFQGVYQVKGVEIICDENKPYHGSLGG